MERELKLWLQKRKAESLYRTMHTIEGAPLPVSQMNGQEILIFSSNNYLNLCYHPQIMAYAVQQMESFGSGSGGARLTTGTTTLHLALEEALAQWKGKEACILFQSGYMANLGTLSALWGKGDVIFSDALNHASLIDGCRLSQAKTVVYDHNDMADLERKIQENPFRHGVIVSDAVFSMDGDLAPLPQLLHLAETYHLMTMIDEAHSTGVLGETGAGICQHYQVPEDAVDLLMGTLSKSLGSEGGYVCASQAVVDYLRNTARTFLFSTAPSPFTVASSLRAVQLLQEDSSPVQKLQHNIHYLAQKLAPFGFSPQWHSAIFPLIVHSEDLALELAQELLTQGIYLSAIRYPTVARGQARLRITVMAEHTEAQIDFLCQQLSKLYAHR